MLVEVEHPVGGRYRGPAPAIGFSDDPEPQLWAAPLYGADSRAILAAAGWSEPDIDAFERDGMIVVRNP
jgi:crotonobetainyl-CoA:carnitine CoA-transferase CaiB-like acyl-CoA transferase